VQLERATEAYRVVLSCELLSVSRLITQRGVKLPPRLSPLGHTLRELQPEHHDQDLRPPLRAADALLDGLADLAGPSGSTS
jgi:hypothetical protein